jgi:hypothetical protein
MFTKACLVSIVILLTAILTHRLSQEVAHAQARTEYKFVETEVFLTSEGKVGSGGQNVKYFSTQDALNEYGKNGWQLVTASFEDVNITNGGPGRGHLIFVRK